MIKARAAIAWAAGQPLEVTEVDVAAPRQGEVLVRIRVDAAGLAAEATVERSSGYAEMDAEALKVARLARFKVPSRIEPDGLWAVVPYRFDLKRDQPPPPANTAREAEIARIIESRRAQMQAEAAKLQLPPQPE